LRQGKAKREKEVSRETVPTERGNFSPGSKKEGEEKKEASLLRDW